MTEFKIDPEKYRGMSAEEAARAMEEDEREAINEHPAVVAARERLAEREQEAEERHKAEEARRPAARAGRRRAVGGGEDAPAQPVDSGRGC